jgi:hypothetical protein
MPGWRSAGEVTVKLDDDGFPGRWVKVLKAGYLTVGELKALPIITEESEASIEPMLPWIERLVIDWNLVGPDSDEQLQLPRDDKEWMNKVPTIVVTRIIQEAMASVDEGSFRGRSGTDK